MEPKDHYCVYRNSPLIPVLSQLIPVHIFTPCFLKIRFHIFLLSTPRSSKWSLPLRLSNQNHVCVSHLSLIRATFPAHLILRDVVTLIMFGDVIQFNFTSCFARL